MLKKVQQVCKKVAVKITDIAVFMVVLPQVSFAADVGSIIDKATGYLQGGLARSIGVGAIVVAGYLCLAKQMFPKMYFMMVLVGLGLIFGAAGLYDTFVDSTS